MREELNYGGHGQVVECADSPTGYAWHMWATDSHNTRYIADVPVIPDDYDDHARATFVAMDLIKAYYDAKITRVARYEGLKVESAKGTPEHGAYHKIVQALQSGDPCTALEACIQHVRETVAWIHSMHAPNGYASSDVYMERQIELYKIALNEVTASQKVVA